MNQSEKHRVKQRFICILIFSFTFFFHGVNAQNKVDSFIKVLNTTTSADSFSKWAYDLGTTSFFDKFEKTVVIREGINRTNELNLELANAQFKFRKSILFTIDGNYTEALALVNEGIPIFEKYNDIYLPGAYNTAGNMIARMGDKKKGINYLHKAIEITMQTKFAEERKLTSTINHNNVLGSIYKTYDDLDSAEFYFQKSYELTLKQKNKKSKEQGFILINLGTVVEDRSQPQKAIDYYKKALDLGKGRYQDIECYALGNLSGAYIKLARYDSARKYLTLCKQKSSAYGLIDVLKVNYAKEVSYYKNIGNYKMALQALEIHDSIKREGHLTNKNAQADFLVNDAKRQEQKDALLKIGQEKVKQRTLQIWLISIIGLVLLLSLIAYFLYQRKQLREQLEKDRVEKEMIKSQIRAISSQMNPHFVFNSLNSIQELIVMNDIRGSNTYLGKFADLMRKTLEYSQEDEISLEQELDVLTLYLDLEQKRFGESLQIEITNNLSEDKLQDYKVPSMLFQPYVENALKHGLLHKKGEKKLSIFVEKNNEQLKVTIEDNGIGREKSAELNKRGRKNHKSYALDANQNRLDLIKYSSGKEIDVEFIDIENGGGTKVVFRFSETEE